MARKPSRRTLLISGATLATGAGGWAVAAQDTDDSDHDRALDWEGQGSEHREQECEDSTGHWQWVLTPGGETTIEKGAKLTVTFKDGPTLVATGERRGAGVGAVHFDVYKTDGGTVEGATVRFDGGGDNPVLTLGEGGCVQDGESDNEDGENEEETPEDEDGDDSEGGDESEDVDDPDGDKEDDEATGDDDDADGDDTDDDTADESETDEETEDAEDADESMDDEDGDDTDTDDETGETDDGEESDDLEEGEDEEDTESSEDDDSSDEDGNEEGHDEAEDNKEDSDDESQQVDIDFEAVCHTEKRVKYTVTNNTERELKFSWQVDDADEGGKLTLPAGGTEALWIKVDEQSAAVSLYFDGEQVDAADGGAVPECDAS